MGTAYRRTLLRKVKIISVTGSLGKSTTSRTIAAVVGDTRLKGFSNTTSMVIRNMLRYRPSSQYAVLETAINGPGYADDYARMLKPDIVIVTSIASEHILNFGSLKNTRLEKSRMPHSLPPGKTVILNADDPNVMWMSRKTRARIITFGIDEKADIMAENIQISPPGSMEFDARIKNKIFRLKTALLGKHMIYPALAALAVAFAEGLDMEESCCRLQRMGSVEARMHGVVLDSGAILIRDDYKATRESVWRALETLSDFPAKRRILVLGGVGEVFNQEFKKFYPDLGRRIGQSVDYAYLYLHSKPFRYCVNGAVSSGMERSRITKINLDPISVLPTLPDDLGKGDVILVKGKGNYKISRLSLALMGKRVNCRLMSCPVSASYCDDCSRLAGS